MHVIWQGVPFGPIALNAIKSVQMSQLCGGHGIPACPLRYALVIVGPARVTADDHLLPRLTSARGQHFKGHWSPEHMFGAHACSKWTQRRPPLTNTTITPPQLDHRDPL